MLSYFGSNSCLFIILVFTAIYYYFKKPLSYWKDRGIPGPEPVPFYGNLKPIMFGQMSVGDFVKQQYDKFKNHSVFGIFASRTPILIINDPELIKEVLVGSFSSFSSRGIRIFEKVEPLSANLVNLEPARWRLLRAKQTTMFTTAKLKDMFNLILDCADSLEKVLEKITQKDEVVECCEVAARYTTDVIGACAFGIDMKALEDEESEFRKVGKRFTHANKWRAFKIRFKQIFPGLYQFLKPIMYDHEINDFFIGSMMHTMKHRKENNVRRGDFVDLLIDLKDNPEKLETIELTDTLLTAQAFAFFFAGFDTSATTIGHALYELALNKGIQEKLREDILKELENCGGRLTYSSIGNMKYLHKVFCETLRKYPVATILTRQATESYRFSKIRLSIPKDTRVWIPVFGIHRDPNIFPEPEKFDPERFDNPSAHDKQQPYYLPFGIGPRNCIGKRFGSYQTKMGIVTIVKNYEIDVCEKTSIPYRINPRKFLLGPAAGINLKLKKLSEVSTCSAIFHALAWRPSAIDTSSESHTDEFQYASLNAAVRIGEALSKIGSGVSSKCPLLLHCAAAGLTRSQVRQILERALDLGIVNVFALRGDFESTGGDFAHASDLVSFIREEFGERFCICVAGYPDMHPEASSRTEDLLHLKTKVDAGADFVIGQICFERDKFVEWAKECRQSGINVPIIPGVYPFQNAAELRRMTSLCKVHLPRWLSESLTGMDDEAVASLGVDLSVNMIKSIWRSGVSLGCHIFTLNRPDLFVRIYLQLQQKEMQHENPTHSRGITE